LNSKPLIHGLAARLPQAELILDLPSRLADRLAAGDLDVALIPTFEAFRGDGYHIVSDACIACLGPVWSVKLLSKVPLHEIVSVALDEGSRTSAALTRLWLEGHVGISPQWNAWPIDRSLSEIDTDAVLIIGDRAMRDSWQGWPRQWDLGQVWKEWTGLPFVFACWVARRPDIDPEVVTALGEVRDDGCRDLESIAAREAEHYALSVARCLAYLSDDLHFHLHDAQIEGLRLFRRLAVAAGLVCDGNELICHGCAIA